MAHIEIRRDLKKKVGQLIINGVDYSMEAMPDFEIVEVGEGDVALVGFRVTLLVGRLDLNDESEVDLTDHVPVVAARVRSMAGAI